MSLEKLKGELIGRGGEKSVYADAKNPERVIGFYHSFDLAPRALWEATVKSRFYLTKIAYFLFPENIPDITLSAMSPNSMGRKKTDFGKDHKVMWVDPYHHPLIPPAVSLKEIRIAEENIGNNEGVAAFIKAMAEVGLEPDGYIRNFGVDDKGVVKYADSFNAFVIVEDKGADDEIFARTFDAEKLKEAIDRLDEKNKKRAREYYDRLIRIVEDAERKWTKHIQREN